MRRNHPKRTQRRRIETYEHIYRSIPERPSVSLIIDHERKLVIHNQCANLFVAVPLEAFRDDPGTDET